MFLDVVNWVDHVLLYHLTVDIHILIFILIKQNITILDMHIVVVVHYQKIVHQDVVRLVVLVRFLNLSVDIDILIIIQTLQNITFQMVMDIIHLLHHHQLLLELLLVLLLVVLLD